MTNRAPKGGTTGMNGYFYAGGEFLPNTTLAPMCRAERRSARPRNYWDAFRAFVAMDARTMKLTASDASLAYYGVKRADVEAACDRYNRGER